MQPNITHPKRKQLLKDVSDNYFKALSNSNFSLIPYHDDVVLRAPVAPGGVHNPVHGKAAVYEQWWKPLEPVLDNLKVEIIDHFYNNELTSIISKADIYIAPADATIRVADRFVIDENGKILEQENHFDPAPIQIIGPINTNEKSINANTPGVHHIGLRVLNLEKAKSFYEGILGFRLLIDSPELLIFAAGRTFIAFKIANPRNKEYSSFSPFEIGLDHIALGIESEEELRQIAIKLNNAAIENTGVKLDETLQKLYIAFKDPDRISWEFYMT